MFAQNNSLAVRYLALTFLLILPLGSCAPHKGWLKIDDFESESPLMSWTKVDAENHTMPNIDSPQVTEVRYEPQLDNHYLLKKPAPEGIVGNRKAISFTKLPEPINVGEVYTFYLRLNVEEFPNNHVLGLSNMGPEGIVEHTYNAFEPTLRVTDRFDTNVNFKNNGALAVRKSSWYERVKNEEKGRYAKPMETSVWYDIWLVVNNAKALEGGQTYDVYIRGGSEFPLQTKVYTGADFRMKRELPIIYFFATCNTGSKKTPYGNGGLKYDDLYIKKGVDLSLPKS